MRSILLASAAALLAAGTAAASDVRVLMKPDAVPTVRVTSFQAAMGFDPLLPRWNDDSGMLSQDRHVPGLDPEIVVHLWDPDRRVLISAPAHRTAAVAARALPAAAGARARAAAQMPSRPARSGFAGADGALLATSVLDGTHVPLRPRILAIPAGWSDADMTFARGDLWSEELRTGVEVDDLGSEAMLDTRGADWTDRTARTLLADELRARLDAGPDSSSVERRDRILRPEPFRNGPPIGGLDDVGVNSGIDRGWENPAIGAGLRIQR